MAKRKRIYRRNPNASFNEVEAQWMGEQLESHGGRMKPEMFVELCKPKNSPGHRLFNWDVRRAAMAHWIERAQYHLRHLDIEIVYEGNKQPIRACYPVIISAGEHREYVSYDNVQSAPDLARQVVDRALNEFKSLQSRYAIYRNVFGPVFDAINQLEKELCQPKRHSRSTASRKTATLSTAKQRSKKWQRPRKSK
jgi:hypothetical protein